MFRALLQTVIYYTVHVFTNRNEKLVNVYKYFIILQQMAFYTCMYINNVDIVF